MLISALSLVPADLTVDQVLPRADRLVLIARPRRRTASCPLCGQSSARVHSRRVRRLADLPWQGRIVELRVRVRRLRCANAACRRRIFCERLSTVAAVRARRTLRLGEAQRRIALALGGEPGSRLARHLAMPVSGDTLLRMIRAVTLTPFPAPRVIGIDEWGWRRGRRYGTIICDLERHRPIDLLPDRQADTVAAWLSAHPGVEIVARDRAGAYADGIRSGAPEAIQVADRWHLLRNLGDALAGVLDRHHAALREAAKVARAGTGMEAGSTAPVPAQAVHPPTRGQQRSLDKRAARQARFDEVVGLHTRGCSVRRIALLLGLERKTVRGWLRSGRLPSWQKPPRGSLLDPYRDHLHRRWTEGCRNATQLWREIRDLGFAGRSGMVRDWATRLRQNDPTPSLPRIPRWKTPSGRRAAWLVIAEPDERDETECAFVEALVGGSATINQVVALARDFRQMLRDRQVDRLDPWLAAAKMTPLRSFADGLCRDPAAVRAALSSPWSTGPVEGQISRLKAIKRQMNGRAGFDLLRQRVLLAA